jgi:tetratricopeptide (TPR) repeat protein
LALAVALIASVGLGAGQDPPQKISPHPDVRAMLEEFWSIDAAKQEAYMLQVIEKAKSLNDTAGEGMACYYMADYVFDYEDSANRLTYYKRAIPLLESTHNYVEAARSHTGIAYIHMVVDEDDEWLKSSEAAARTSLKSADAESIATAHGELAWVYDFLDRWKDAALAYRIALQHAGRLPSKQQYQSLAIEFIEAQVTRDLMDEAIETALRAVGVLESAEDGEYLVPRIEARIGIIYALQGHHQRGHDYLAKVLETTEDDPELAATVSAQMGAILLLMDKPLDAAVSYRNAAKFSRDLAEGEPSIDEFLYRLAEAKALAEGGKGAESKTVMDECEQLGVKAYDESESSLSWMAIASVAIYTGDKDRVQKASARLRETANVVEGTDRLIFKYFVPGRLMYFISEYEDAETDFEAGLKEVAEHPELTDDEKAVWRGQALYLLGEVYSATSRPKKASECFKEAEEIDAKHPGTLDEIDVFDSTLRGETDDDKKRRENKSRNDVSLAPPSQSSAADFGAANLGGDIRKGAKDYALIIACEEYARFGDLSYPLEDAADLAQVLRDHFGFEVQILRNPKNKGEVRDAILAYNSKEITPGDQLLVFFAGHGGYDATSQDGYLAFGESDSAQEDSLLFFHRLEGYLSGLKIRHIALVLDSCFGGTFLESLKTSGFRAAPPREVDPATINRDLVQISRKVLASGAGEVVPDRSVFARRLIEELMTSSRDVLSIFDIVAAVQGLPRQTPVFSGFKTDRPNGTFLFIRKKD